MAPPTRRGVLVGLTGTVGALAGCNSPGGAPDTTTAPPATVSVTDHFVCLRNRDDEPATVAVSIDATGEGDSVGFQREVPPETAETVTGVVPGYGQYDVTVRVRGSEFASGWSVERDRVTGVRVTVTADSVTVATGVTGECQL